MMTQNGHCLLDNTCNCNAGSQWWQEQPSSSGSRTRSNVLIPTGTDARGVSSGRTNERTRASPGTGLNDECSKSSPAASMRALATHLPTGCLLPPLKRQLLLLLKRQLHHLPRRQTVPLLLLLRREMAPLLPHLRRQIPPLPPLPASQLSHLQAAAPSLFKPCLPYPPQPTHRLPK